MQMKILFLTNKVPWPLKDGGAIGVFSIAYGLALSGCKIEMLSMNTKKHNADIDKIPGNIKNKLIIDKVDIDTKVKPLDLIINLLFSNKPYIAQRFYKKEFKKKLIDKLKDNKYDVIILDMLYLGNYIQVIRQYSDAHITLRAPNIEHEIWEHIADNTNNIPKRLYLKNMSRRIKKLEYSLLNTYDSLMPVSKSNAETYKNMGLTVPVKHATTGVFFEKIDKFFGEHNSVEEELALAHIGALDWIPNIEGLLWFLKNVWPRIHKEKPQLKFYIAGRNAHEDTKVRFNQPNVIFLGEVNDAYEFLSSKAILIVPLLSGSGMRVKIIEGLAMGKPIVSTSKGAEGIEIKPGKHLEIADSDTGFAKACLKLLSDKKLRNQLSENGRMFVRKNYDNMAIAEELKDFYTQQIS